MSKTPTTISKLLSLTEWEIQKTKRGHEVRIELTDPAEARLWAIWLSEQKLGDAGPSSER